MSKIEEQPLIAQSIQELDAAFHALVAQIERRAAPPAAAAAAGSEAEDEANGEPEFRWPLVNRLLTAAVLVRHARWALTVPAEKFQRPNQAGPGTDTDPRTEMPPPGSGSFVSGFGDG